METILIATDFSSAARNATIYGFELARLLQAKVILFTAYQLPAALPDNPLYISREEVETNTYKKLLDEAEAMDPKRKVALETLCLEGPVNNSVLEAAAEKNVSYIVAGMKERGKEIRKYFGSTVTHLCKTSPVPLVIVPAEAAFSVPKTIALASDINEQTDVHILQPLKKIAESFQSQLYIVRVIKKSMDEVAERVMRSESLTWFLSKIQFSFRFIKAENVAKAMNEFVDENSVDMITVIPHEHTLFERIFTRSVTKDLVFNANVPLLILPSKNEVSQAEAGSDVYSSEYSYGVC